MRPARFLSFSNVIAVIALFVALGGAAYAGSKINGRQIVSGSIGGGKLRNETITAGKIKKGTITGAQIAQGTITGAQINLSSLGTVPSAQNATSAQTAASATTAQSAARAETAMSAQSAINATSAQEAETAATAGEAETLDGKTAADLTLACRSGTEAYGGMCWDATTRPSRFWLVAVRECGEAGGRLPTISELIAFVLRPGEQVAEQVWSGDLDEAAGSTETAFTSDENGRGAVDGASVQHGFRCVFLPTN